MKQFITKGKFKITRMNRYILISGVAISVMLLATRCYYDSQEYLYPQISSTCDTTNVTYSGSIVPVLSGYCISCHNPSNPNGGVTLDSYAGVSAEVANGFLLSSIKQDGTVPPMPQSGGKLDNCQIATIAKWIREGALQN